MTSLLTHIDASSSQSNLQHEAIQDISIYIPKLNDTVESDFSNLVKPSSLLAKRLEVSELGDLITKRIKTQSTNVSENGSIQHSPTSKKNSLANEKDKNSTDDAVSTTFTRCSSSESALGLPIQDSLTGFPIVIDVDAQSEESGVQLQLALNMLREKMIEQEAQNLLEIFLIAQLCQEPLYIPPLVEAPTTLVEPVIKKQANKKDIKKMELDQDVTFGTIEYPFLSISTPFPADGDISSIPKFDFASLSKTVEDSYADLTCKDPYLEGGVPAAMSSLEKKVKKTVAPRSPGQESTSSTKSSSSKKKSVKGKEERKMNGKKVVISKIVEKVQKKGKENDKEKKMEKEVVVESSKTVKQEKNEDIYARPVFGRRFTQRTKNKWQIAQDEKVKDIVLPALNFNGGYELFFEGNKKKPVPIGEEYQTDMSIVAVQSKTSRRKPQLKWNPSTHCEGELKKFFGKVKTMVKGDINEEKVVGVILENDNDLKRALKYVTANKAKCLDTLRC